VKGVNELFYDPAGSYYDLGHYRGGAIGGHRDHVHAATFDRGGWLQPGLTLAYNGTGQPEHVGGGTVVHVHVAPNAVTWDIRGLSVASLPELESSMRSIAAETVGKLTSGLEDALSARGVG
jgi:hypothetical protein